MNIFCNLDQFIFINNTENSNSNCFTGDYHGTRIIGIIIRNMDFSVVSINDFVIMFIIQPEIRGC